MLAPFHLHACPVPPHLTPPSHRLESWLAIALFLLHERAMGNASRWAPYIALLPADSGSPVQWEEADLAELQGSQVLGTVQGYRAYFQQRFDQLQAEVFGPNSQAFDPIGSHSLCAEKRLAGRPAS